MRDLIDRGTLGPGARLPPERDLALQVGVSRPTVRAGLRTLAALGVIRSRRGSGTYIAEGPPTLGSDALSFLAALHKFTADDVYEARRILEVGAAGLAAERATPDHLATLADEVAGLFASLSERQVFLVHDINFHRGVAAASGNPIVASLVEMVSALDYERRRTTAERAVDRDLRDAAEAHRQIYQAIRARDVDRARRTMNDHLLRARSYQAKEQETQFRFEVLGSKVLGSKAPRFTAGGALMTSLFDLTGRTAVVIGGTTGIGRALALGLADAGADVVATGRRPDAVNEVVGGDRGAGTAHAAASGRRRRPGRAARPARCVPRRVRAGRRPGLCRRHHEARGDARDGRGGLECDSRHQRHRHVPRPIRSSRRR